MNSKTITFFRCRDVKMPERGTLSSGGIDLFYPNDLPPISIESLKNAVIPSGLYTKFDDGQVLMACNRGGMGAKRSLIYGAHMIDSDYQGEIFIDLHNIGTETQIINPGDKIIQLLLIQYTVAAICEAESVDDLYRGHISERGDGSMGSTERK